MLTIHGSPDSIAVIDGADEITYGELALRIGRMRGWLEESLRPVPGSVIAATLDNCWEFIACLFAVTDLGCAFMPCYPQWRVHEVAGIRERSGFCGMIRFDDDGTLVVDSVGAGRTASAAAYLSTSGSTGTPKIVPRSHRNLAVGAANVGGALGIGAGRRVLSLAPFYHSNGFHNGLLMPLLNGATLVLMRRFGPAACSELIDQAGVDSVIGAPFHYSLVMDHGGSSLLRGLQLCISAGARMPVQVAAGWRDKFGVPVRQLYGSTETSVISIDLGFGTDTAGFVGTPITGVEVRCLESGEIAVRSPAVMSGYVGEDSSDRFCDGFFRTGDYGRVDERGGIYLSGRVDRVMSVAGIKVDPVEIELVIEAMAAVLACKVDSVESGPRGSTIRASIALRPGAALDRSEVIAHCRKTLAEYKLPRIVEFDAKIQSRREHK